MIQYEIKEEVDKDQDKDKDKRNLKKIDLKALVLLNLLRIEKKFTWYNLGNLAQRIKKILLQKT